LDDIANDEDDEYKVKMRSKDASVHIFTIKIKRIQNEYIINLNDITKLEKALLQAYSSEKAKTIFLANMSHEIRTPLNGILGFTDLLSKRALDSDAKRYVEIIHKSGETLLNVVNDILDFSKIESGELTLYETQSNLFEEMEAAVSTFASISKKKKINYYVYIDTNIPKSLQCDVQRLKQVMSNLISNAIKFTPEGGEVFVRVFLESLRDQKAKIHFSVKDSGIGIAKEKIQSVFQAFSQADNSISREFGGTGLGLAISNQYIQMMGSSIELKSEIGKGSEFYFDLELDVVDASSSYSNFDINNTKIAIMNSYDGVACGINEIVYRYLNAWECQYNEINELDEIDESVDILVVCAKFFDQQQCRMLLERYPALELVYIEGLESGLRCEHERFHLIEQPMTGSALFDTLISLMDRELFENMQLSDSQGGDLVTYDGDLLVAEDNETNQMLISILLQERSIRYKIVNNGVELLDEVEKNDIYDLIFMDINMPLLDGIDATKALRKKGYTKPIVSLSANVIESDTKSFKEAGMDDTLNKPIIPKELDAILSKFLQKEKYDFDCVVIEDIAKSLSIADTKMVKQLLGSLAKTFKKSLDEIKEGGLNKELLHKLKGAAGNMRFEKFYKFILDLEGRFEDLNEKEREDAKSGIEAHLENALLSIENL
jgi:signal transduction histidine kinase/DNA-binding NarL/FixJ family response regulator